VTKASALKEKTSLSAIAMKDLLEAGVHFGHQTKRWNPKMKPYIFGERNGIYILDLGRTAKLYREAAEFLTGVAAQGGTVLFVGTKRQAQDAIAEEAQRCGMFFVNQRWLGGLLTNFSTIQRSLARLRELEAMTTDGRYETLSKKEIARLEKERRKLAKNLDGIRGMNRLPDVVFVVDTRHEQIAVDEARKLKIRSSASSIRTATPTRSNTSSRATTMRSGRSGSSPPACPTRCSPVAESPKRMPPMRPPTPRRADSSPLPSPPRPDAFRAWSRSARPQSGPAPDGMTFRSPAPPPCPSP
jgi:ribosomal protein S2